MLDIFVFFGVDYIVAKKNTSILILAAISWSIPPGKMAIATPGLPPRLSEAQACSTAAYQTNKNTW